MEERAIKRLLIILAVSIIAIVVIKVMLTKTYSNLNDAVIAKKHAAEVAKTATPEQTSTASEIVETPMASSVSEVTTQALSPASGIVETR